MPDANAPLSNAARMRRLLALALVLGVLICFWAAGVNELLSAERLFEHHAWLRRTIDGNWPAAVAVYAAAHILAASLAAPGGLMTLAAGFLFGPATGTLLGMGCAAAGAGLLLLAARRGLRLARLDRAAPLLERVRAGFRDAEWSWLLFMRLTPLFPFALTTFAAAALGARLRTLIWTTFVGVAPAALAWAMAGDGLARAFDAGAQAHASCVAAGGAECALTLSASAALTPGTLAALFALGALALLPLLASRRRLRTATAKSEDRD